MPARGASNGTLTLGAVTGGASPYTYSVDGSPFSATLVYTNRAAASHSIDVRGCQRLYILYHCLNKQYRWSIGHSCNNSRQQCGTSNGSINLGVVTGGVAPYTYSVDGSAFTATTQATPTWLLPLTFAK